MLSEAHLSERVIDTTKRVTAALVVCGLLSGPNVTSVAEPEPVVAAAPDKATEAVPAEHNVYYGPQVTPFVSKIMADNVVLLTETNCSGFLIRDKQDKAIGALTAKHCGMEISDRPRFQSSGKTYVKSLEPIIARVGSSESTLRPVAAASEVVVHPANNIVVDNAFMVFDGSSPQRVLDNYRKLSSKEIEQLGHRTMYMSGWPIQQLDTLTGQKRHDFALTTLGTKTLDDGRKVLYAAMRRDERGAECSYGGSGSEGFVVLDGQPWSVGTLTTFNDIKPGGFDSDEDSENTRKVYEERFGMSLATYDAVCGFAIKTPDDAQVLHLSPNPPDPVTPQESKRRYQENLESSIVGQILTRAEFFDNNKPKTVLQGIVRMEMWKGSGFPDGLWMKNPALLHDEVTGLSFLAGYHSQMPENLLLVVLGSQPVDVWSSIDANGHEEPTKFVTTAGKTETAVYPDRVTANSFRDEMGLEFAMTVGPKVPKGPSQGRLVSNNGVFEVHKG